MAVANTRMTVGSVLGLVQTAANTVTGTLDAMSSVVGMGTAYIENAADQQRMRIAVDKVDFTRRLAQEHAQQTAARLIEVDKFKGQSEAHATYYGEAYAEVIAVLKPVAKPAS